MDIIFLRAIRLDAMIGIYKRERTTTQPVEIDLDMGLPNDGVFKTGRIADTIDYAIVISHLRSALEAKRFGLVEEMAQHIADLLLQEFGSPWVKVSVAKMGILQGVGRVGVVIEREAVPVRPDSSSRSGFATGSNPFAIPDTAP